MKSFTKCSFERFSKCSSSHLNVELNLHFLDTLDVNQMDSRCMVHYFFGQVVAGVGVFVEIKAILAF